MKVIGQDNNGEPIWQLTPEEYQQWKREAAAARERAAATKTQRQMEKEESAPETEPEPTPPSRRVQPMNTAAKKDGEKSPQTMELGSRIWEMRKRGLSVYEIHRREGIPMDAVKEILASFERCFYPDVGAALHHYAMLDDARLESLIGRWLPLATGPAPEIEKMGRNGQSFIQLDTET